MASKWRRLFGVRGGARQAPAVQVPNPRASSLPYISGDTFRSIATFIVEKNEVLGKFDNGTNVIFCQLDGPSVATLLDQARFGQLKNQITKSTKLVLHNGDETLGDTTVQELKRHFGRIFSVNQVGSQSGIQSLPIGLENSFLKKNGKLEYYLPELQSPTPIEQRRTFVMSSFHVSTNPKVREPVANIMRESRHGHHDEFFKAGEYRDVVRKTKFVISPPGNGNDCHRTWEAIYLGAVPVVLEGFLDEGLVRSLPILAVSDYQDFCALPDHDLNSIYSELKQRSTARAFASYWLNKVLGD